MVLKKIVHWSLLVIIIMILLSGFGITEYRFVEAITFGILNKALAFQIHFNLWGVLIIFLALHFFLTMHSHGEKNRKS